jgi:photosystem II stability/assembly factor-like uncharacterized protein
MRYIILIAILFPFFLQAQWKHYEIDGIDKVYDVFEKSDTTYLCSNGALLVKNKSTDNWLKLPFPDGLPLSAHKADGRLYVGAGSGIYFSDDFGATWVRTSGDQIRYVGYLASMPDGTLLAASNAKGSISGELPGNGILYVSRNRGQTWSSLIYEIQDPQVCLGIDVVENQAYVFSKSGIYVSNSAVSSLTKMNLPSGANQCLSAAFSPDKNHLNIVVKNIFGLNQWFAKELRSSQWSLLPNPVANLDFNFSTTFISQTGYEWAFAGLESGIFALELNWQSQQLLSTRWRQIFSNISVSGQNQGWLSGDSKVQFIKTSSPNLFCSTRSALYSSKITAEISENTWQRIKTPTLIATRGFVVSNDTIFVASQGMPFSYDSGKNWISSLAVEIEVYQIKKIKNKIYAATSSGLLEFVAGLWLPLQSGQPLGRVWTLNEYKNGIVFSVENQGVYWLKDPDIRMVENITFATNISVNNVNLIETLGDTVVVNLVSGTQQGLYRGYIQQGNWFWERFFGIAARAISVGNSFGENLLVVAANWSSATPLTPAGGDIFNSHVLVSNNAGRNWTLLLTKKNWEQLTFDPNYQSQNSHSIAGLAVIENRIYASVYDLIRNKEVSLIEVLWDREFNLPYHFNFGDGINENYARNLSIDKIDDAFWLHFSPSYGSPSAREVRRLIPTGLDENQKHKLYPNPTKDYLFWGISDSSFSFVIYDVNGRRILSDNSKKIDVSNLETGFYYINLIDSRGHVFYYQFIKE